MGRKELHKILKTITPNVYYQEPSNIKMKYPCIKYTLKSMDKVIANNSAYGINKSYTLTVIDEDPDSTIVDRVALLEFCKHDRHYVADGLHHNTFVIYY